jgi:hypothetical protein
MAVPGGVQNINPTQQILAAEDLTTEAAQHDHPIQRDLVPEDLAAEEVHLVPHYNKHGKGVTKETVEDAVFETTVVGIETTDKCEPVKDWAARQKYRETTLKTTTRPAPARRRTPLSSPLVDADEVEETPAEGREGDRDAYVEEFHRTEGVHWEVAVRYGVDPVGIREDGHTGECDDCAQKRRPPGIRNMMTMLTRPKLKIVKIIHRRDCSGMSKRSMKMMMGQPHTDQRWLRRVSRATTCQRRSG